MGRGWSSEQARVAPGSGRGRQQAGRRPGEEMRGAKLRPDLGRTVHGVAPTSRPNAQQDHHPAEERQEHGSK